MNGEISNIFPWQANWCKTSFDPSQRTIYLDGSFCVNQSLCQSHTVWRTWF